MVAGPKNLGMEVFASEMTLKNGDWYGQIVNPETGATYYTRLRFTDTEDLASRRMHGFESLSQW